MIGTGAMVPLPDQPLSSVLVRANGRLMLLDCGEGTQTSWRRFHWGFRRLDVICLSHLHADHVAGLPGLLHTVANAGKTDRLVIYGPKPTALVVLGLRVIAPVLPFEVEVVELEDGDSFTTTLGLNGSVRAGNHRGPVLGYRFEMPRRPAFDADRARALGVPVDSWSRLQNGKSIELHGQTVSPASVEGPPRAGVAFAFITDTRPTPSLLEVARGVDVLISEGTYGSDEDLARAEANKHMTFREAATLARNADARHLWLTHLGSRMDDPSVYVSNATDTFGATMIAHQGMQGRLSFERDVEVMPWKPGSSVDRSLG